MNMDEELTGEEATVATRNLLEASLFGFSKVVAGATNVGKGKKTLKQYLTSYYSLKRDGNIKV
jgi:hypothetical protein